MISQQTKNHHDHERGLAYVAYKLAQQLSCLNHALAPDPRQLLEHSLLLDVESITLSHEQA